MYSDIVMAFMSPKRRNELLKRQKASDVRSCREAGLEDWSAVTRWQRRLYLRPKSFLDAEDHLRHLRPSPYEPGKPISLGKDLRLDWFELPRFEPVGFSLGMREGMLMFSQPHSIPRLAYREHGIWKPRMSLTPQEVLTQRRYISRCKGTVMLGGLGIGWSLQKIAERKQVERIIVVEKDPKILMAMQHDLLRLPNDTKYTWVVGDVKVVSTKLKADVLYADIWDSYGDREYERRRLIQGAPQIPTVLCWGRSGGG